MSAGAAAPSGGSGGTTGTAGANAPAPDAGMSRSSDQDGGPGDVTRMRLNDAQIAAVLSAVNTAETGVGMYAVTRATTPAVRAFAQSMVEMHNTSKERQTALFNTLMLTLETSNLSAQLTDTSTATMTQLMSVVGTEFDAAYVRSQVDAHTQVLMIIDEQLLPNVTADALRSELVLTRTQVATHIDAARTALQTLEAEDTDAGIRP